MRAYADSSFLVKLISSEPGTEAAIAEYRRLGLPRLRKKAGISRSSVFITRWKSSCWCVEGVPVLGWLPDRVDGLEEYEPVLGAGRSGVVPAGRARTPALLEEAELEL